MPAMMHLVLFREKLLIPKIHMFQNRIVETCGPIMARSLDPVVPKSQAA